MVKCAGSKWREVVTCDGARCDSCAEEYRKKEAEEDQKELEEADESEGDATEDGTGGEESE